MFGRIGRDNLFLMLALLLWSLGEGMWFNLRQILLQQLGATPQEIGLAGTLESVGRIALLIPAGFLVDRIGPRTVILAGWLIGVVSIALMAISPTWPILTLTLSLYASTVFVIPAISAYAVMAAPEGADPQRTLSIIYVAYPIGQIISPTVGGILADTFGSIRSLMWLAMVLYAFSTLAVLLMRHIEPHPRESGVRVRDLFGNKPFMRYAMFFSVALVVMWVSVHLLPNFLDRSRDLSVAEIGIVYSILGVGTVILNLLLGRTHKRVTFLLTIGIFWLAIFTFWQVALPVGIGVGAVLLGVVYFLRPSALARLEAVIRPQERGVAYSGLEVLFAAATAIAAGVAGQLFAMTPTHDLPFIVSLALIPFVVIGWFALGIAPSQESQPVPAVGGGQ